MSDEKNEKLTDHDYDGIQELDNSLPQWWLGLLYLTLLFGAGYYCYYELGSGPSIQDEFASEVAAMESKKTAAPPSLFPEMPKLVAYQTSAEKLAVGKTVFQNRCVSCHGDKGQGLIGPNLTDDYWIHGDGKIGAIAKVVHDGVLDKGMPPWVTLLTDEELYSVTAYVKSLRGTNPAGAKASQGNLVKE
ncbi:MAG: c-type cytochrome [Deltaproteobacteria bacterium]|nr:c-type cytochrome [Deltaproteobacteria bacterium]